MPYAIDLLQTSMAVKLYRKTDRWSFKKKSQRIASRTVVRNVLAALKAQHRRRVVVLNNNQVEAVIVPVDDYEKMAEALDLLEHMEIHRLVTQRSHKKGEKIVTLE